MFSCVAKSNLICGNHTHSPVLTVAWSNFPLPESGCASYDIDTGFPTSTRDTPYARAGQQHMWSSVLLEHSHTLPHRHTHVPANHTCHFSLQCWALHLNHIQKIRLKSANSVNNLQIKWWSLGANYLYAAFSFFSTDFHSGGKHESHIFMQIWMKHSTSGGTGSTYKS